MSQSAHARSQAKREPADWLDVVRFCIGPVVLALFTLVAPRQATAEPPGAVDATIAFLINAARDAAGLPPLQTHIDLVQAARAQSSRMVTAGRVFHTESDRLRSVTRGWTRIAENVGGGPTVEHIHAAFLASPPHAANILGDFNYLGIGAQRSPDGLLFVAAIFARIPAERVAGTDDAGVEAEGATTGPGSSSAVPLLLPH